MPTFNDSHAISPGKNVCSIWPLCTLHSGYLHCVDYVWFSCSSGLSWRRPVMDQNCLLLLLYLFSYWLTGWCFPVPILHVKGRLTLYYRLCCDKLPYRFQTFLNTPLLHAKLISTDDSTRHMWHLWPNLPCSFIRRETIFWCSCGSPFLWSFVLVAFTEMCQQISHLHRIKQNQQARHMMTCKHVCNSSLYRTQTVFCVRNESRPKKLLTIWT